MTFDETLSHQLQRIADALEAHMPAQANAANLDSGNAFVWDASGKSFCGVKDVQHVPSTLLCGIEDVYQTLYTNTEQFAAGFPANNALLWGTRGMGKSASVKAVWAEMNAKQPNSVVLIEIHREDIEDLPLLMRLLRPVNRRFIILCDDLSFDAGDTAYKSLKTVLDGGIEGRPDNVIFYATSNRRHLMPRETIDQRITPHLAHDGTAELHAGDGMEEKISLSDRFGLWLGFHACSLPVYLEMVRNYADYYAIAIDKETLNTQATLWANTRGTRSGRVAWQFIQDLAGRNKQILG